MPALRIGRTEIEYELVRSSGTAERRIVVTPGHVQVLAHTNDAEGDIAGFLERKRSWLFNTVREMQRVSDRRHSVPRFMTGTKIPYRGRLARLTVRRSDAERMEIDYKNGFVVNLPHWAQDDLDLLIASELKLWLKQRFRRQVRAISVTLERRFAFRPQSVRVAELAQGWGSCGVEDNISINWNLVFAPPKVAEYVVLHELLHLRERSHGRVFWSLMAKLMPDYEPRKRWLEANEAMLSADFLAIEHAPDVNASPRMSQVRASNGG
jgi:predicted metal-dependent hydrolase